MKLIAIDGDHTLWEPASGVNLSDRSPTDDEGRPDFTYTPNNDNPLVIERDDGALFTLRPEARDVLSELRSRGALTGLLSYNHEGNVRRALEAFGVGRLFDYMVAEWHTNKDRMLEKMIAMARCDGRALDAGDVLLVDDDPDDIYAGQCKRMGVRFCRFGVDVRDLREVLRLLSG